MYEKIKNVKKSIYKIVIDNRFEYNIIYPRFKTRILRFEKKSDFVSVYNEMGTNKEITASVYLKFSVDFWIELF